ncbi:hypothetical protein ZIOFF_049198 [Zingiber officinale]|uniref:Uncharacterized protein n=1 Tax=Zingiber officinale TaxID=94328 RepID=A0A8J5KYB4_ZINOF|nr:hypothetical protein ZIOFF_049198 [Zingiber officinale]
MSERKGDGNHGGADAQTLVEAALEVLNMADPFEKARLGEASAVRWLQGAICIPYSDDGPPPPVPDRPARLTTMKLVSPSMMPKLGKAGSLQSRQAIVHSLAHTESWAIDLSWDIIARFGRLEAMPREFFTDFVKIARDEGRHFTLLAERLEELGTYYGALPAHDGLWDSALETSKSLLARLAVEHCVHEEGHFARECSNEKRNIKRVAIFEQLDIPEDCDILSVQEGENQSDAIYNISEGEDDMDDLNRCDIQVQFEHIKGEDNQARGLDVLPTTISRFRNAGDERTATLLETVVYPEEITHCAAGVKWFRYLCLREASKHHGSETICGYVEHVQPMVGQSIPYQQEADKEDGEIKNLEHNVGSFLKISYDEQELVIQRFHATVREHFRGPLKPPFNAEARKAAGFGPDWYEPLASK